MAATALRTIFPNWVSKKLQVSDLDGGIVTLPPFVKYETVPFKVIIVQPDVTSPFLNKFSRVDVSPLSLKICINDTYDDAAPLACQDTWSKNEDQNWFTGELELNTSAFNTYIDTGATSAYLEIELTEGTARSKIYVATIALQNAVGQVSATSPDPVEEYYTKPQTNAQFVQKVMPAGEQLTITSPGNVYQRILCVDDYGNAIDTILPV